MRRLALIWILAQVLAAPVAAPAGPASSTVCTPVHISAPLSPDATTQQDLRGTLCGSGPTLLILLSGATYGSTYWDFPYEPETYSFVRALAGDAYTTLNLDRPGIDRSSRPPAHELTVSAQAYAVHRVVAAARAGTMGAAYERIVLVGHSLGSVIAMVEESSYHDVDALILTGLLPHAPPVGGPGLFADLWPAHAESRLADRPAGYVTTRPGTRREHFYHGETNGTVVAFDENTKQTASPAEVATIGQASAPETVENLSAPVLWVVGAFDGVFCPDGSCASSSGPAYRESAHYPKVPCAQTFVLDDAGHSINLHPNAGDWYSYARVWLDAVPTGCR